MRGVSVAYQAVTVADFPEPLPGPGEVRVKIKAATICRTDLTLYHGKAAFTGLPPGPIIAGHEPAGLVEATGPGVTWPRAGDRVAVYCFTGCGHCPWCRQGYLHHCAEAQCLGFHRHGGDAEYLVVPAQTCLPIPDDMSYLEGALSTDLLGTLYQTEKRLGVTGADTVAIFGLGPMGSAGLLIAKAHGATVIAVDIEDSRLTAARELGADHAVNSGRTDPVAAVQELTGGGVTVAIDTSGAPAAQQAAISCIRPLGRVGIVGGATELTINPRQQLIRRQALILANWYFNIGLYEEAVRFLRRHDLRLERLVTHRFSLEQAEEAFRLFDQHATGKVAFLPDA